MPNPFKPTAGKMPPILIGRQRVADDFKRGIKNGAGAPERLMLITGQRGFGKTVMLTELGKIARRQGWEVYSETASENMVERLASALRTGKPRIDRASIAPSLSVPGVASLQLGGIQVSNAQQTVELRDAIESKLKKLPKGKGILFTIDESQAASRNDLVALATTLQHVIRDEDASSLPDVEKRGIALAFAALPSIVDDLVNDEVLTFLRRATREELGAIPEPDVRNAYVKTVRESRKEIGPGVAASAAQAACGNPYLVQLIGYYMWESADVRQSTAIEEEDMQRGIEDAITRYDEAVCAPTFNSLSAAQRDFLTCMSPDYPSASSVSNVAKRAGKSASWGDKYRISLIRAHVICADGPGMVRFDIPYFGDWMQRKATNP